MSIVTHKKLTEKCKKLIKSYDYKRLKKCVLSFLRKLVRDKISLMSDGSAFQARGLAMEKALSVT